MLCSDFLIINTSGDMTSQMKELITICDVYYDQLRGQTKAPQILYTFVNNSNRNPENYEAQISSLRQDVIESSDSPTIVKTADELRALHNDSVKVLGSAYDQVLIEKDSAKGNIQSTQINLCVPSFGVDASFIWQQVNYLIQSDLFQARQIEEWLQQTQDHWSLIDRHGAAITEFANVLEMKNDRKIKQHINQLWEQYINTQIKFQKDDLKSESNCIETLQIECFLLKNDDIWFPNNNQNSSGDKKKLWVKKVTDENDQEKERDFQYFIIDKLKNWLFVNSQSTISEGAILKHMKDYKMKMQIFKYDYKFLMEDKLKELKMLNFYPSAISEFYHNARNLFQVIKKMPKVEQDQLINEEYKRSWAKLEKEIRNDEEIVKIREKICKQFYYYQIQQKLMPKITSDQCRDILIAPETFVMYPNSTLPKSLVEYLVNQISNPAFITKGDQGINTTKQFRLEKTLLQELQEDPTQRIFGSSPDAVKEKYLCLQNLFKVDYTYFIADDLEGALRRSSVFELISQYLGKQKDVQQTQTNRGLYGEQIIQRSETKTDDKAEIVNSIHSLFKELGQAGFVLEIEQEITTFFIIKQKRRIFVPLGDLNVAKIFEDGEYFNNENKKKDWLESLKTDIKWQMRNFKQITPRVESLLSSDLVLIRSQPHPNISFDEHQKDTPQLKVASKSHPEPKLSYSFSEDDKQGKVNVRKFLQEKNLDSNITNYQECLIRPKYCDMSDEKKQMYLSELANAVVDWRQIVLDIDQSVSPIKLNLFQSEFLNHNTDRSHILFAFLDVTKHSDDEMYIEKIHNPKIKQITAQLDNEVSQKLSLKVSPELIGAISWAALVILFYKSLRNNEKIFNEKVCIKNKKSIFQNKFYEIAKGQPAATTSQFAVDMFNHTFKKLNDKCLKDTCKVIQDYIYSKPIKERFEAETIYNEIEDKNLGKKGAYDDSYLEFPINQFDRYVQQLWEEFIRKLQVEENNKYKQRLIINLKSLQERLLKISQVMKNYEDCDSINFFEILKAGKKIDNDEEKEEIVNNMSPILLKMLREILDGKYIVKKQLLTLTINGVAVEYSFCVKQKDPAKNIRGSLLNDLQKLAFSNGPKEFLNEFFEMLDFCKDNANFGVCTDLRVMVGKLNNLLKLQISEKENLSSIFINSSECEDLISSFMSKATGCRAICTFCSRKCELAQNHSEYQKHNCDKRGHSFLVFGGGTLNTSSGEKYPSLTTCDEIKHGTKIEIVNNDGSVVMLWPNIPTSKYNWNLNWNIDQKKVYDHTKFENFWNNRGKQYCSRKNYTFLERKGKGQIGYNTSQMKESSIIILCLDESGSMFNKDQDFGKQIFQGKMLEQYLKKNHLNPSQVHIQLWFNDCRGVNGVYQGQLSSTIPSHLWVRAACQGDEEIRSNSNPNKNYGECGQFTGVVRILNQEVNNLLASDNYNSVQLIFFTDGDSKYPEEELISLQQTLKSNRQRWTDNGGNHKLNPMIITNKTTVETLWKMKVKIDEIMKEIWQVKDACALNQNVQTDQLAEKMIKHLNLPETIVLNQIDQQWKLDILKSGYQLFK